MDKQAAATRLKKLASRKGILIEKAWSKLAAEGLVPEGFKGLAKGHIINMAQVRRVDDRYVPKSLVASKKPARRRKRRSSPRVTQALLQKALTQSVSQGREIVIGPIHFDEEFDIPRIARIRVENEATITITPLLGQ